MTSPSSLAPVHAWGFLPREQFQQLPPHPTRIQPGHPQCRAVAAYDVTGVVQHFVLPLDRTKSSTIRNQVSIWHHFWENSPMSCAICSRMFSSAVSTANGHAFSFFEACPHGVEPPAADTSDDDSDSEGSHGSIERADDLAENLATAVIMDEVGYNPINGNLIVVKHTIVESDDPAARVLDAQILDVLVEEFPLLLGLVHRSIAGDSESGRFLPSPYVFRRRGV
ncbi:hypothetical protein C8F01DRAFT_1081550 [Mycena amicta]|nr:hypothetical protein C8F01DRAFT_1250438 [Mycena amicta]KAJ7064190.1 hypothetical protein C8F01DRAFT_1081550 [Mycena amicta]